MTALKKPRMASAATRSSASFVGVVVAALVVVAGSPAAAQEAVPTFSRDVAPIFFEHCIACHREGEVAPMSLVTYQETRPWSRSIKRKVVSREMPPWHADPRYGDFRNARGLDQAEIDIIVAWVDGGAPAGAAGDLPSLPEFTAGWSGDRDPDYIIDMPVEFAIDAQGQYPELDFYTPVPFEDDRFVEALEIRPGNRSVVHHAGAYIAVLPEGTQLIDGMAHDAEGNLLSQRGAGRGAADRTTTDRFITPGASKLLSFVPGRGYERYASGAAKRINAGAHIDFEMHYNATGREETDRSSLGLWFARDEVTHEIINSLGGLGPSAYIVEGNELRTTDRGSGRDLPVIPPHVDDWELTSVTAVRNDTLIHGLSPHLHLRGKSMTYVVTYPSGETEVLLSVPAYDFNWQHYYDLTEPKRIPAGSKLTVLTRFDNSIRNRYNPAPDKEVYWGDQSWDEMYSPQVRVTVDKYDLTAAPKPSTDQ